MTQAQKRAEQIKAALSELIRGIAKDRESKERLAKYLGKSFSVVEGMAYRQQGGFESWVNALLFLFDLDANQAVTGIKELYHLLRKTNPLSESDRMWFEEIDQVLSEEDKIYWLNIMKYAAKLRRSGKS